MLRLRRPAPGEHPSDRLLAYDRAISAALLAAEHELSGGRNPPQRNLAFPKVKSTVLFLSREREGSGVEKRRSARAASVLPQG